ncbi:hypothetical protein LJC11_02485 [Bacteroidales bacterium OttesenSCG-928-I21]|nr:hypothetical protein [Bacteroidales bacterium OttesenSCG-928-I21]
MRHFLNKIFFLLFLLLCYSVVLFGQESPDWLDVDIRLVRFSNKAYLTGYAEGNINTGETLEKAIERIKTTAQGNLLESIRVNMKSHTLSNIEATSIGNNYYESETFSNQIQKYTIGEIIGMKVESYFDKKTKIISAFAYVNRIEIISYYKSILSADVSQVEGLLQTIQNLEINKEKNKARQECKIVKPLFSKIRDIQGMLIAIEPNIPNEDLQHAKIEQYYNIFTQLEARLDIKYELIENFKSNLSKSIIQIEGLLQTARELEISGEKPKARQQCESAQKLFITLRTIQDSLSLVEPKISANDLQQAKTEQIYNDLTQMSARLSQATLIYVESNEDLFDQKVNIVANKLKAELAVNGCSFTEDTANSDFTLRINAKTRESSTSNNIVFCYVDIVVELYDNNKQKTVFNDELAEKGGSSSLEKAARKAMENAVPKIINKISNWIK